MTDRVRNFAADLWFDLRERRLIPVLVGLVAVAVALPFVLGGSSEPVAPSTTTPVDVVETRPAVAVADEEGVRGGERLSGQAAKNPFRQQLQSLPESGRIAAGEGAASDATEVAEAADAAAQASAADQLARQLGGQASVTGSGSSSGGAAEPSPATGGEPTVRTKVRTKVKRITETIVKVERNALRVRFGKQGRRNKVKGLESLDQLPRSGDPVLVLLGVDGDGERATFDVASRVKSVWGDGRCAPAKRECDYLKLKLGQTAKLRYVPHAGGDDEPDPVVYSLTLVRVSTKHLDR